MKIIEDFSKVFVVPLATEVSGAATAGNKDDKSIFWGDDNLYPQYLNFLYGNCAVHQGIVNGKVFYTTSGGLKYTEQSKEVAKMFEGSVGALDLNLEISNSYFVKVRVGIQTKKIDSVTHIPYEWVRPTTLGNFEVSQNWVDSKETKEYLLSRENWLKANEAERGQTFIMSFKVVAMQQLLELGSKDVSLNYFPTPPYQASIKSILSDIEMKNYTLSEIANCFSLGTILAMNNGKPTEKKDQDNLEKDIRGGATGSANAGGVMITYNNGKDSAPTVVHLNGNQLHERYVEINKDVLDNILFGHAAVSGELFGFKKEGSFNADNLEFTYWLFKNNYVKVRQQQLLTVINKVCEFNGVPAIEFNEVEFYNTKKTDKPIVQEFSDMPKVDDVIGAFSKVGRKSADFEFLASEPFNDVEPFKDVFASSLPSNEIKVLTLIADGDDFENIAKALKINYNDLVEIYKSLAEGGHIDKDVNVTKKGKTEIVKSDISKMEIVYSYDVKPKYGAPVIDGTRDFCRALIELNKVYTRQEIDNISAAFNTDVWRYRGGWYHNPDTKKNERACRHEWSQKLIYKNN